MQHSEQSDEEHVRAQHGDQSRLRTRQCNCMRQERVVVPIVAFRSGLRRTRHIEAARLSTR